MRALLFKTSLITLSFFAIIAKADDAALKPAATRPTSAPVVIKWEDAAKHVGETVTITGPVKGTHVTTDQKSLMLNIGFDYPDTKRFTVMIAVDDKNPTKEADFKGKTVTVTGKVELYRKAAEIKVAKAADVTVEKK